MSNLLGRYMDLFSNPSAYNFLSSFLFIMHGDLATALWTPLYNRTFSTFPVDIKNGPPSANHDSNDILLMGQQ